MRRPLDVRALVVAFALDELHLLFVHMTHPRFLVLESRRLIRTHEIAFVILSFNRNVVRFISIVLGGCSGRSQHKQEACSQKKRTTEL